MVKNPKSEKSRASPGQTRKGAAAKYPRRTERRKRTRATILKTAREMFGKSGYGATTMQSIADAADVHVTTLFMHFNAKSDLAFSLVAEMTHDLHQRALTARGEVGFFDFFREEAGHFANAMTAQSGEGRRLWSALRRDGELAFAWSQLEDEQLAIFAAYVAEDYALNRETDYRPDLVAQLMMNSLFLPHRRWIETPGKVDLKVETLETVRLGERAAKDILSASR